ncbi:hypothetical protein LAZ67_3004158 [Cordylochernes scorpioides]|uniref:Reverse transcriptase domain-containing protein n=1 Tax=Cordylochernes scorpioides TaxID=51811 RepID=A0ABY6KC00_9ARAC|nr:hypothetical protein LAZ67_3004158 [Cordylochernes scorpioides]
MTLSRKRRKCYMFFVDLKKAFDTVPHSLLWRKLLLYTQGGPCPARWIRKVKSNNLNQPVRERPGREGPDKKPINRAYLVVDSRMATASLDCR